MAGAHDPDQLTTTGFVEIGANRPLPARVRIYMASGLAARPQPNPPVIDGDVPFTEHVDDYLSATGFGRQGAEGDWWRD